jgi:hypothetical protein
VLLLHVRVRHGTVVVANGRGDPSQLHVVALAGRMEGARRMKCATESDLNLFCIIRHTVARLLLLLLLLQEAKGA